MSTESGPTDSSTRIGFDGRLVESPVIRAGFIGCGSHAFRNVYPTFQFTPVNLVATCDRNAARAMAFAKKFGATASYSDHREMLRSERLDAVFIVTGTDERGRPLYPELALDCLEAGCHVWLEKPPAFSCDEIVLMREAANLAQRNVMVGFKKMFFPANEKAKELMASAEFGSTGLVTLQYPQHLPTTAEFQDYRAGIRNGVTGFLDHLCHPLSLLLYLVGMPQSLFYERSSSGAGAAIFRYDCGVVASLAFTAGSARDGGMERTMIVSTRDRHIVVDNNHRVYLHRTPPNLAYGVTPSYFSGTTSETTAVWDPEFSLGQLYNKGLFLLGYYGEIQEFASSILEKRKPVKATLDHAWQVTRIFEAFAEGSGKVINLH